MPTVDDWANVADILKGDFRRIIPFTAQFLRTETSILRSEIVSKFYTGKPGLNRRSGKAAKGWQSKVEVSSSSVMARIFNDIPYADHSKEKTIKAPSGGYLAIPVGPSLTPSGVPRYAGPRSAGLPKLSLVPMKSRNGFVMVDPKQKDSQGRKFKNGKPWGLAYFLLLDQVKIPARTAGLEGFVKEEAKSIANNYGISLGKELGLFK